MGLPKRRAARKPAASPRTPAARKKREGAGKNRESTGKKRESAGKKRVRPGDPVITVRRIHRRDLNRVWEFLKLSFAKVNLETVEYQRPRSMKRFMRTYDDEGIDQLVFEVEGEIVAYAECAHEVTGSDNWINENYFERRKMEPLYIEELAVHPNWNGRGVGSFVMQQLEHLAKVRGLSHLVLEVAENNEHALQWYRKRGFRKLDSAIFLSLAIDTEPELLPPKPVSRPVEQTPEEIAAAETEGATEG